MAPRAGAVRCPIGLPGAGQALIEFLVVLLVLVAVVLVVGWPLRAGRPPTAGPERASELPELEAAREAKYREIRDAELDHRTGKLSDADFRALEQQLRAEAVEILHEIDRYHERLR